MPTYTCNTPVKTMLDLETKETTIIQPGEPIELSESDAEELLKIEAISGPVTAPPTPKKK